MSGSLPPGGVVCSEAGGVNPLDVAAVAGLAK